MKQYRELRAAEVADLNADNSKQNGEDEISVEENICFLYLESGQH